MTKGELEKWLRAYGFEFEILSLQQERSIVHWSTAYWSASRSKKAFLDGIFVLRFTKEALCKQLHEWWHHQV